MRVELDMLPKDNWIHFLRARDLEQIFASTPAEIHGPVLEIGCGDGFLTSLLRQKFKEVFPIDLKPRGHVDGLSIANAEALPFRDKYFGCVLSSNVLEHLENLTKCFEELGRVMRDDGIMIHTIPTPTWKVLQLALRPFYLIKRIMRNGLTDTGQGQEDDKEIRIYNLSAKKTYDESEKRPSWLQYLGKLRPPVHGAAPSHIEEIRRFRVRFWADCFESNGFRVIKTAPLYLHSAYRLFPYRWLGFRERMSIGGLNSVNAYWLKKVSGEKRPERRSP